MARWRRRRAITQGKAGFDLSTRRKKLISTVRRNGLLTLEEPVELASGAWSQHFIDGKRALAKGSDLRLASEALWELVRKEDIEFDVVGGLTMGADAFAHEIAVVAERSWFSVRKEPKGRGTNQVIEGAELGPETRVLLVDDVVTTGGSIKKAYDAIANTGAKVVAAVTLVDRGEVTKRMFERLGIFYEPLVTYKDLGIDPVDIDLVKT